MINTETKPPLRQSPGLLSVSLDTRYPCPVCLLSKAIQTSGSDLSDLTRFKLLD